jgi:hypothetical protein
MSTAYPNFSGNWGPQCCQLPLCNVKLELKIMRFPLVLGALVLAAPLHAEPAPQPTIKDAEPSASAPMSKPNATAIPIESVTPQPQSVSIDEKVGMDWPRYDTAGKGHLTKAELDQWFTDLRASSGDTAPDAKWLGTAFGQTDSNKDKKVSREELTAFLTSGR